MLTDEGDLVIDPFGGSCVTGAVCERLDRKWMCIDLEEDYLTGAVGRFADGVPSSTLTDKYYEVPKTGSGWDLLDEDEPLPEDGGRTRRKKKKKTSPPTSKVKS